MDEKAMRWVSWARGLGDIDSAGESELGDAFADVLNGFGYSIGDVSRMDWLAAAVLVEHGACLREYVERFGGDLSLELRALEADAVAAMNGDPPTDASRRHDIRSPGFRPSVC